jgi:SagB-type dehydrogenase family enzyme
MTILDPDLGLASLRTATADFSPPAPATTDADTSTATSRTTTTTTHESAVTPSGSTPTGSLSTSAVSAVVEAVPQPGTTPPVASPTTPKTTTIDAAMTTSATAPHAGSTATTCEPTAITREPTASGSTAPEPVGKPEPAAIESGGAAASLTHTERDCHPPFADQPAHRLEAKSYPDTEAIPLSYPPRARVGFCADTPQGLGDLLALAYGFTRIDWGADGIRAGRPLPSGGAAYPGELYLAAEFGLCHYLPSAHALERLQGGDLRRQIVDALEAHPAERPALILVLTSRHEANLPSFGGFGHKLQTLDAGVMAGQALSLIEAAGAEVGVHTRFDEAKLNRLLGLDPEVESVRAVVTAGLGHDEPVAVPAFSTDPGASRAGIPRKIMARRTAADGFEPVSVPLARVLEVLDAAAQEIPSDIRSGHGAEFASIDLYCVANRVDGLDPACYRRSTATGALVRVRETTDPRTLFPVGGEAELAHFQAACALMIVGDYEHGYRVHGDRWYRMLNLQAGIIAQRIGLAATGLGLGSMLRCDYQAKVADRLIHAAPGRTALVTVLVGLERGVGKPGHRLLLGGYGS